MALRKVVADIAGTVLRIEVPAGSALAEDDPILILEAMKMEIPLVAPRAGRLLRVLVGEGEGIREGQVLAEMECD